LREFTKFYGTSKHRQHLSLSFCSRAAPGALSKAFGTGDKEGEEAQSGLDIGS
jgi:hypothetical protein